MSLNGLDDPAVAEAYSGALAEAGGWFLLQYQSRDSVGLLTRGTGGASELRAAVDAYDDKSPLYGFLLYRRRKVLIRYLPDGTSRLLQARVAVHFTAVTDKFAPHDTTFDITAAHELGDAQLAAACSLHTAAPSSSCSSLSSRKQKLDEITEDQEDGQSTAGASESASTARPSTARTLVVAAPDPVHEPAEGKRSDTTLGPDTHPDPQQDLGSSARGTDGPSEPPLHPVPDPHALLRTHTAPAPDSFKQYDALFENGPDPRLSSQTTRPDLADLYAEIYAQYNKPKVKLGPRPKPSLDIKRPNTAGHGTQDAARAVSSLPAGLRASSRKPIEPKRPKSRDASTVPSIAVPPPPPIPAAPDIPLSPIYPPRSPASIRSLPMNTYSSLQHKSPSVTPEKQRLMRALELRRKQMEARKAREEEDRQTEAVAEEQQANTDNVAEAVATPHDDPTNVKANGAVGPGADCADVLAGSPSAYEEPIGTGLRDDETKPVGSGTKSEVGMTAPRTETDDMHSGASASSPTSAQTQSSSVAPSTRPSSMSDDEPQLSEHVQTKTVTMPSVQTDAESISDENISAESTPTVIPDDVTVIPSVKIVEQDDAPTTVSQDAILDQVESGKKRESLVLKSANDLEEARARRRSKRASMVLSLSSESLRDARVKTSPLPSEKTISDAKESRRLAIDPTHLSAENSEVDYLSDDSFMEELQSAKFEEAMPVSVSKSPIMPFFPRKPSSPELLVPKRSASQQQPRLNSVSPEHSGPRKLSGPWMTHSNTDTVVAAKKINVGSGISQRIKALAEKSNRDSTASLSPVLTPDGSSSIVAQRKSSFFSTLPDGDVTNGKPSNRMSRASFINVSRSTTPEPKPSVQATPMNTPPRQNAVYNVQQEPEKLESVQVTARIVRDAQPQNPVLTMPSESSPLELHQSPIIIDHQKSTRPATSSSLHSPIKTEPTSPRPPSSSQSNEPTSNLPRSSSESSWRSFGRRLSESKNGGPPRSMSTHSFDISSGDEKPSKKEKKDSRTSKLFKRMSSISSITRKNSAPNIVEAAPTVPLPSLREPPSAVQVGDLNIQFPDTLLWKRRWVEIDASGNLVLSLSKTNEQSKGITRRFNLTELRAPYAPDQDRQELPNSVVLDFLDGRTLQLACETYSGQVQVLAILHEAHAAWADYNKGV